MTSTDTRDTAVIVEVWHPPKRLYVIVAALFAALLLVVSAPVVVAVSHQVRLNDQAALLDRLSTLETQNRVAIRRLDTLEKDRGVDIAQAAYDSCLARLQTWEIADRFVLLATSPGAERERFLALLPPQPKCVKPSP